MKNSVKIGIGIIAVLLVVGAAVYFANPQSQKGAFGFKPRNMRPAGTAVQYSKAFTLVDGALLDDDFDGVPSSIDKCSNVPAHQIVRFGAKDWATNLGQQIQLDSVDTGLVMTFLADGIAYGVSIGQNTYIQPTSTNYPGFTIRGLFAQYSPNGAHEAIVIISRTDYNIDTGC